MGRTKMKNFPEDHILHTESLAHYSFIKVSLYIGLPQKTNVSDG